MRNIRIPACHIAKEEYEWTPEKKPRMREDRIWETQRKFWKKWKIDGENGEYQKAGHIRGASLKTIYKKMG